MSELNVKSVSNVVNNGVPKAAPTLESLGFASAPKTPDSTWIGQKSILCGGPKVGKSSFLAEGGESTFFMRLAPEFTNLTTYGADCKDYSDVSAWITKLYQAKNAGLFKWDTIVFDPASRILDFLANDVAEAGGVEYIGDIPHGKGWMNYKNKIKMFLHSLEDLPAHKIFVFHTCTKEMAEAVGNKTYSRDVVPLSEKTESEFTKAVDSIFHIRTGYVGTISTRSMITQGNKYIEAGTKVPSLQSTPMIQWGNDNKANYAKFRGFFQ
jgi:hypothetical protein